MDLNTSNLKKFEFEEGYNFYEKLKRKNPLFKRKKEILLINFHCCNIERKQAQNRKSFSTSNINFEKCVSRVIQSVDY